MRRTARAVLDEFDSGHRRVVARSWTDLQDARIAARTRLEARAQVLEQLHDHFRVAQLREQEELDRIRPPLDGRQVMAFLGVDPGPIVGEALDELLEIRLDEGPIAEDEAYRRLAEWARERGIEPAR